MYDVALFLHILGVVVLVFGASQILAFLYPMTNKPGYAGAVAACVVAAAVGVAVASLRLRSLRTATVEHPSDRPASEPSDLAESV